MKKTLFILPLFVFLAGLLSSCSQAETYAEQKDKEYKAINSFLGRDIVVRDRDGNVVCNVGKIKTISEETFLAQDSTTDRQDKNHQRGDVPCPGLDYRPEPERICAVQQLGRLYADCEEGHRRKARKGQDGSRHLPLHRIQHLGRQHTTPQQHQLLAPKPRHHEDLQQLGNLCS